MPVKGDAEKAESATSLSGLVSRYLGRLCLEPMPFSEHVFFSFFFLTKSRPINLCVVKIRVYWRLLSSDGWSVNDISILHIQTI